MVMTMEEAAADWMWTPYSAAMAKSVVKAAQPQVCWQGYHQTCSQREAIRQVCSPTKPGGQQVQVKEEEYGIVYVRVNQASAQSPKVAYFDRSYHSLLLTVFAIITNHFAVLTKTIILSKHCQLDPLVDDDSTP